MLLEEVSAIDAALRKRGREVIVLKGLHLAEEYFGELAARHVADIDILIEGGQDLRAYEEILTGLGYFRRSWILGSRAMTAGYTHHLEFDGARAPLDLHWVLRQHPSFALDYSEIWRRKRVVNVRQMEHFALDVEYLLVLELLSIHTDIQVGFVRIKSFIDVYVILKRVEATFQWNEFLARRVEERLLRISINLIDLVLEVLDCREEFPNLAEAIARYRRLVLLSDHGSKLDLVLGGGSAFHRRAWALQLYEISTARAFFWWAIGFPFRVAEHRPIRQSPRPSSYASSAPEVQLPEDLP